MNIGEEELRSIMGDHHLLTGKDYSFYKRLCSMSHRVKTFNREFCERKPAFEEKFIKKKYDESYNKISANFVKQLGEKLGVPNGGQAVLLKAPAPKKKKLLNKTIIEIEPKDQKRYSSLEFDPKVLQ